ncbi:hypothetical protein EHQ27_12330 [Leptospira wolffii]|uniref:hypothetical protein n=1 Tax=Leptospira wolffii TaxID=409998 RepID=UPI0010840EC9|nr:hypothetical protein [Leptospira wolffii]TGK62519.1 hypothetical protein EHQ32_06800 [Leptospira wolffii]TGK70413.1 hypothetical protein EHQ27_12330 [Leptospira wolffii]TGK74096.1 hypothetical protein EHQ35_06970 [Leptospira wolffii]TGL28955.1 hypothetical protein EHQ57_13490 [Leptospira wolffii]
MEYKNNSVLENKLSKCNVSWKFTFWAKKGDLYMDKDEKAKYNELLTEVFKSSGFTEFVDPYKEPKSKGCRIAVGLEKIEEKFTMGGLAFFGYPLWNSAEFNLEFSAFDSKSHSIRISRYQNKFKRYFRGYFCLRYFYSLSPL